MLLLASLDSSCEDLSPALVKLVRYRSVRKRMKQSRRKRTAVLGRFAADLEIVSVRTRK